MRLEPSSRGGVRDSSGCQLYLLSMYAHVCTYIVLYFQTFNIPLTEDDDDDDDDDDNDAQV